MSDELRRAEHILARAARDEIIKIGDRSTDPWKKPLERIFERWAYASADDHKKAENLYGVNNDSHEHASGVVEVLMHNVNDPQIVIAILVGVMIGTMDGEMCQTILDDLEMNGDHYKEYPKDLLAEFKERHQYRIQQKRRVNDIDPAAAIEFVTDHLNLD